MFKTNKDINQRPLTPKQSLYALEYIKDFNGKQAAIRAGYSPRSAEVTASRLLRNDKVSFEILSNFEKRIERTRIDADYVKQRLVAIVRMSIDEILNDDFTVKPLNEWPPIWRQTISGLDVKELIELDNDGGPNLAVLKKIRWPDKLKALGVLGRHVGVKAFSERIGHEHGLSDDAARSIKDVLAAIDGQSTGLRKPLPSEDK